MKESKCIVVPFILPWDRPADYQRQTCLELSRYYKVVAYMQRDAIFIFKAIFTKYRYPAHRNIRFYRPLDLVPFRRFRFVRELNVRLNYILFELFFLQGKRVIVWIFDPAFYFLTKLTHGISLYDCVDYHAGFHKGKMFTDTKNMEHYLIKTADYFFVNSHSLYSLYKNIRTPSAIVPLGFKLTSARYFQGGNKRLVKKPVIGYIGALDYRLDTPLLGELIRKNPQWNFVLWGPSDQDIRSGLGYTNVFFGQSKNFHHAISVIKQFDIGIIPFKDTFPAMRYSYPTKLLEYFYFGKPVISSRIEELKRFTSFVKMAETVEEWEYQIQVLLKKSWPRSFKLVQRKIAVDNSWSNKIKMMISIMHV